MHNLIYLFKRYKNLLFFLGLELVCLIIFFKNNHYQQASYLNSAQGLAASWFQRKQGITDYLLLKQRNAELLQENARLKSLLKVPLPVNPLHDTSFQRSFKRDSVQQTIQYNYIAARVINNTVDQKRNYITLNVGETQGVKKNMAVINERGIVGKITHVSSHYAVAATILSEHFNISAQITDGTMGKVAWDGLNSETIHLSGIPQSVKLKKGDSVFSSGYSVFPEHILIGTVLKPLSPTTYRVMLSTRFSNLHHVYIVNETMNIERKALEDTVANQSE
ncbi:MAG: rod shape-determining protein MreC [Chitinophagaceae bacterium]|nr:rod shape-determining protein MreC [Chitinophagaceae bacterium]